MFINNPEQGVILVWVIFLNISSKYSFIWVKEKQQTKHSIRNNSN